MDIGELSMDYISYPIDTIDTNGLFQMKHVIIQWISNGFFSVLPSFSVKATLQGHYVKPKTCQNWVMAVMA
jgi:hypothetical protein